MKNNRKEIWRAVKFTLFSASAGIIEFVSFTLLNEFTFWSYWPCYLIALVLSVLWNFTLNRKFTFRSANNVPLAMLKVALYYAVFTPLSTILGNYLVEKLLWNEYLVTAINMILNYSVSIQPRSSAILRLMALTTADGSKPCTAQASSRLSPWEAGQPRQCIPIESSTSVASG